LGGGWGRGMGEEFGVRRGWEEEKRGGEGGKGREEDEEGRTRKIRSVRKERETYTTMGAIRPTPLLGRLVHLDVLDDQVARVEPLGVSIRFGVLEQAQQELGGFFRPPRFRYAKLFACVGDGCELGMLEGRG